MKKIKHKKGFTLIEVLGVIVIIAVIALITVPIIINIIEKSKEGAFKNSAYSIFDAYSYYETDQDFKPVGEVTVDFLNLKNNNFVNGYATRTTDNKIEISWVTNGSYCAMGTKENMTVTSGDCSELDITNPNIVSLAANSTSNSISATTVIIEKESFIGGVKYRYVLDGVTSAWVEDSNISQDQSGNYISTVIFNNLLLGKNYTIEVEVINTANENTTSNMSTTIETNDITFPECTFSNSGIWTISKTFSCNTLTDEDYKLVYSVDGSEYIEDVSSTVFTSPTTISLRIVDKNNDLNIKDYGTSINASMIDPTVPTVSINKVVNANSVSLVAVAEPETTPSGYLYQWYKNGEEIVGATLSSYVTSNSGTYMVRITTGAGNYAVSDNYIINSYNISYNGNGGSTIEATTKVQNIASLITTTVPTRVGYSFMGWGLSSNTTTVSYVSGANYINDENITLYALWSKVITATFVANGSTISTTSAICTMYNADTSCNITTPTITRSGYTVIGYNTSSGATTSMINSAAVGSISSNGTYYAITSKVITITFNKNNATSQTVSGGTASTATTVSQNCTIWNTGTSCNVISPTIVKSGYTIIGYNTNSGATTSIWNVNVASSVSSDATYYAIALYCPSGTITLSGSTYVCVVGADSACSSTACSTCSYSYQTTGTSSACGYASCNYTSTCSGTNSACGYASCTYLSSTTSATANTTYSCSSGYTLSGTSCTKTESTAATANFYWGPTSTSQTNSCSSNSISCSQSEFTHCNTSCSTNSTGSTYKYTQSSKCCQGTYSCSSGYTLSGTTCTKTTTVAATANTTYSCSSGTLSGTSCLHYTTGANSSCGYASCNYSCSVYGTSSSCGYASCTYTTSTTGANCSYCGSYCTGYSYSCPSGYSTYSGSGSSLTCYKNAVQ